MKRCLIEYNPSRADIPEASAREKNIRHGYSSSLRIGWARRPIVQFSAKIVQCTIRAIACHHCREHS
jgi:adenine-specific DNA methylase